jgi:hypothetical protein
MGLYKTTISTVLAVSLVFAGSCARKRPGETPAETTARKKAVYSAQTITALRGWSDLVEVLARNGVISAEAARGHYIANQKALTAFDIARQRLQSGFPSKELLPAIESILADVDAAERAGLIDLDSDAAVKFQEAIFAVRFTLGSIRAVLIAASEPEFEKAKAIAKRAVLAQRSPVWWTEAVLIAQNTAIRMLEQSRLDTAAAWADAEKGSAASHAVNAERMK